MLCDHHVSCYDSCLMSDDSLRTSRINDTWWVGGVRRGGAFANAVENCGFCVKEGHTATLVR